MAPQTLKLSDTARDETETGPPWVAPLHDLKEIDRRWLWTCALLSMVAMILFGWRALLSVAAVGAASVFVYALIAVGVRYVRRRRRESARLDSWRHALTLGLLLGLCLPVLVDLRAALVLGAALGGVAHLFGRSHRWRVHPVAVVMAALLLPGAGSLDVLRPALLTDSGAVLRPNRLVLGDVTDAPAPLRSESWWESGTELGGSDAVRRPTPAQVVAARQRVFLADPPALRDALRAGALPRLSAVVVGVVPGAAGAVSLVMLLGVGLWLMHARMARVGVAVTALVGAVCAQTFMPVRIDGQWTVALARFVTMGAPLAVWYVGYTVLASALPMAALVLAPSGAPLSRAGRWVYGFALGAGAMVAVWWLGRAEAAYLALLLVGLLARPLDGLRREVFKTHASAVKG